MEREPGGGLTASTIVIGLDGANWELLMPWVKSGELPNLKYLIESGSWGDSRSQLPTVTCPNWKCYSTGKNPAKLGVFWWRRVDKKKKKLVGFDSRSFKSKEIFDYINQGGMKVGVVNMPTTYPPKKLNGFMITSPPDSAKEGFTYPAQLEKELEKKYDYLVHPPIQPGSREDLNEHLDDVLNLMESRFKVAWAKKDEVDFLHVSVFYINVLQHFFFDEGPTKKGWKLIDKWLGKFHKEANRLILMSDHGIHPTDTIFHINTWLQKEGYLKTKTLPIQKIHKLGINNDRLGKISDTLHMTGILRKVIPTRIITSLPSSDGTVAGLTGIKDEFIDWEKTRVLATGQGTVYILADEGSKEYEQLRNEMVAKLTKLRVPGKKKKVAKKVYKKEDIYKGKFMDIAPDIVFEQERGIYTVPGIGDESFTFSHKWRAENKKEGMCLFHGIDIKKDQELHDARIIDLAPTILYWMGLPVPKDMDGRVLKEIFAKGSEPEKRNVKFSEAGEKERLRDGIKGIKMSKKL